MTDRQQPELILPPSASNAIPRRRVLQMGGLGMFGLFAGGSFLAACGDDDDDSPSSATTGNGGDTGEAIRVGFAYIGPINDNGWTEEHHRGRQLVVDTLGDKFSGDFVENVLFDPAVDGPKIEALAQSHDFVICNTEYGDMLGDIAEAHPDVKFLECDGHAYTDNLYPYYVKHLQPAYAMGVAAALLNEGQVPRIGYIGAFPTATAYNDVNGLLLGARSINPQATVQAVMISSFFDPPKATAAAQALLGEDINFLFAVMDEPSYLQVANERGVWAGAWNTDVREFGPDVYVNTLQLDFGQYYLDQVNAVRDGTWEAKKEPDLLPLDLGEWGDKVPQDVRDQVDEIRTQLLSGELNPYTGPLVDTSGEERLAEGETIDDQGAYLIDWAVEGVTGVGG